MHSPWVTVSENKHRKLQFMVQAVNEVPGRPGRLTSSQNKKSIIFFVNLLLNKPREQAPLLDGNNLVTPIFCKLRRNNRWANHNPVRMRRQIQPFSLIPRNSILDCKVTKEG